MELAKPAVARVEVTLIVGTPPLHVMVRYASPVVRLPPETGLPITQAGSEAPTVSRFWAGCGVNMSVMPPKEVTVSRDGTPATRDAFGVTTTPTLANTPLVSKLLRPTYRPLSS